MNIVRAIKYSSLFATILLVTACQHPSIKTTNQNPLDFYHWHAVGKISLRVDASRHPQQRNQTQTIRFSWQQHDDNYTIKLSGTFGLGATTIKGAKDLVEIARGNKVLASSNNPDQLLKRTTGLDLPVNNLRHWALGLSASSASDGASTTTINRLFRCKATDHCELNPIQEDNWAISYPQVSNYDGLALPKKMLARTDGIQLTIVVNEWLPNSRF